MSSSTAHDFNNLYINLQTGFIIQYRTRTQDEEAERNLDLWLRSASSGRAGSRHFLLCSNCPLAYCVIKVCPPANGSTQLLYEIKEYEDTALMPCPGDDLPWSSYDHCYTWYLARCQSEGRTVQWTKEQWSEAADVAVKRIDAAVRRDHGVLIYRDGNIHNHILRNVFVVHIVDALLIEYTRRATEGEEEAEVYIQSRLFNHVGFRFRDRFFDMDEDNYESDHFILNNRDMFLVIFSLWGNFSHIPIRVSVSQAITEIPVAESILNNAQFKFAQWGKKQQLKRSMNTTDQRMYYALI